MPSKISLKTGFPRKLSLIFKIGSKAVISKKAKIKRADNTTGTSAPFITPASFKMCSAVKKARVENKKLRPKIKFPENPASIPFCVFVKLFPPFCGRLP